MVFACVLCNVGYSCSVCISHFEDRKEVTRLICSVCGNSAIRRL